MKETARRKLDGFLTLWISCTFPLRQNHALLWSNTIMYKVTTHHLQHLTISSTAPVMIFSIPSLSLVPQVTVQILSSCANLKKIQLCFITSLAVFSIIKLHDQTDLQVDTSWHLRVRFARPCMPCIHFWWLALTLVEIKLARKSMKGFRCWLSNPSQCKFNDIHLLL